MKIFFCTNIASGKITNQWDDSNGLDETYYEPSFGSLGDYSISTEDVGDTSLWAEIRSKRDALLSSCDWTQLSDSPLSSDKKALWVTYRQALRDLPDTQTDINNIVYPTKPS